MRLKIARLILITIGLILFLTFLGEMAIYLMSYSMAKGLASSVSLSGEPHRFTELFFGKIKGQAIWMMMLLVSCGIFLGFFWKKVEKWIVVNLPNPNSLATLCKLPSISRTEVYILFILIGLGIVFRLVQMQGIMERDELHKYLQYAQNPILAVSVYISDAPNHIFHTFLVSLVTKLFGDSYWAIRSIAFISGILLVPLVFLIVRSIGTAQPVRSGWLAATIMAASPLCCQYSANARGYTLQMLLGLLAWALFLQIYEGKRDFILMVSGICALALWTIPTSLYLFVGLVFAFSGGILQNKIKAKDLLVFIIFTSIITLLLWSPVIIVSGIRSIIFNSFSSGANPIAWWLPLDPALTTDFPFWQRFKCLKDIMSLSLSGPGPWVVLVTIFIGISAINGAWQWIGAGLLVSILTITVILHVTPHTGVWLFLIPFIAILIDIGISNLLKSTKRVYGKSIVVIGGLCIIYIIIVLPQVLDYGPGHKEISAFASQVAKQWYKGQAIAILVDKDRLLKNSPDNFSSIQYYNSYTVRYYLKRQGIPDSAFKWREHSQADTVWLISVQADGLPIDLNGVVGKNFHWDLIMGPYALSKGVTKDLLSPKMFGS